MSTPSNLADLLSSSLGDAEVTSEVKDYLVALATEEWLDEKRSRADIDNAAKDLIDRQLGQTCED